MTDYAKNHKPNEDGFGAAEIAARASDGDKLPEAGEVLIEEKASAEEADERNGACEEATATNEEAIGESLTERDQTAADERQVTLDDVMDRIGGLENLFKLKITRSEYEAQVLKRYSDEIHEYKSDLYKKITLPLLKEIIAVRDAACSMVERAHNEAATGAAFGIDSLEFICDMLESALDNYGVIVRHPEIGEIPHKGTDRPIARVETSTHEEHGTIAAVMNDAYLMDGKCIVPAKVKVFVYDDSIDGKAEIPANPLGSSAEDNGGTATAAPEEELAVEEPAPAPVYKPE